MHHTVAFFDLRQVFGIMVGFARGQIEHTLTLSRRGSFKTHSSCHVNLAAEVGIKTRLVDRVCRIEKVRTRQVVIVDDL